MRVTLVNPNTSAETTHAMVEIAQACAPPGWTIDGLSAQRGSLLIVNAAQLRVAAGAVLDLAPKLEASDGIVVAAFGDPGLAGLRRCLCVPVVGIGEASMAQAARFGPFGVATTTPDLADSIEAMAADGGYGAALVAVALTKGQPEDMMGAPEKLHAALAGAVDEAVSRGARAVIIGGGPLARAARALSATSPVPLVEPIPAAVAHLAAQLGEEQPIDVRDEARRPGGLRGETAALPRGRPV